MLYGTAKKNYDLITLYLIEDLYNNSKDDNQNSKRLLRPAQTREHCYRNKIASTTQKCFWGISKVFAAFKTQIICFQQMLLVGTNEEWFGKHWRNTNFECLPIVSSFAYPRNIFWRRRICILVSASFTFAHSCNIMSNIDSKCFSSNVSWFAPAFTE